VDNDWQQFHQYDQQAELSALAGKARLAKQNAEIAKINAEEAKARHLVLARQASDAQGEFFLAVTKAYFL
jgi:hypothetical protein